TGASGYVGGRLVPELLSKGYTVRAMARSPLKLSHRGWDNVEVIQGDVLKPETLVRALDGIDAAYYLIHSMTTSGRNFAENDISGARNFALACEKAKVRRIIYLGGLGSQTEELSKHLSSRHDTGDALRSTSVPVTEFRSAIVVGSGSASFEIIRDLVARVPIMICPRWVQSRCEPISIRQLLEYLVGSLVEDRTVGEILEIGNGELLTYADLMRQCASVMGKKIWILPVPVLTPRLSSYWLNLVTSVPTSLARPLVDSLRHDVVCRDRRAANWIKTTNYSFKQAVSIALTKEEQGEMISRWTDATTSALAWVVPDEKSFSYIDRYETKINAPRELVFKTISRVGGTHGWFHANWLWKLRATLDRLVGGVGMRRGRPTRERIRVGDPIDFWRVEEVVDGERLMLRAEMKLPGVARLLFEIKEVDLSNCLVAMTARFWPRGIFGRIYWYAVLPLHSYVFGGMIRQLRNESLSTER
ncbi:MAG: SDR family oxidoreductase, partial [Bdellovibrionales bacterium]|nr:SDR family oxidoreductase [Bdellovibrionales bacterium]